jgi:hypothetical protein
MLNTYSVPCDMYTSFWFQTFAVFCMLYVFFWVIPRRLNSDAGESPRRKHTTCIRLVCKTYPWSDASTIRQKLFVCWIYTNNLLVPHFTGQRPAMCRCVSRHLLTARHTTIRIWQKNNDLSDDDMMKKVTTITTETSSKRNLYITETCT